MLYTEFEGVKDNTLGRIYLLKDVRYPAKTLIAGDFAYNPAWYEDNNGFVFVNYEETGRKLIKSTISGSGRTYVTRNPIGSADRHPSVRGNMILCDTTINGRRQIVSLLDNGTEVTILGEGYSPSCHPTAKKAVFIKDGKIFEMDLVTTQVTEVYSNSNNYKCDNPSYSRDGQTILFQRENAVTGMSGVIRQHIFSISASGSGGETPLVYGNVDAACPTWGMDNTFYFISNAGGKTEIWRANLQ
ncbi:MAG: hypothetical protein LBP23_09445 [Treponema sp.]|nr:hypothetical protein [Treponema sp.]